jgi:hypothetical protein
MTPLQDVKTYGTMSHYLQLSKKKGATNYSFMI